MTRSTVMMMGILCLCLLISNCSNSVELALNRTSSEHSMSDLTYTLPVVIDKQHFKLKVTLGDGDSWVKGSDCHICNGADCKEKCTKVLAGSAGFKCHNRKTCQKMSEGIKQEEPTGEVDGDMYKINLTSTDNQPIGQTDLLIASMVQEDIARNLGRNFDGELNLLSKATMLGGVSKLSLLYPEKTPILVLGDPHQKYLLGAEQVMAADLAQDGTIQLDGVQFDGKSIPISGRSILSTEDKQLLISSKVYSKLAEAMTNGLKQCEVALNKSRSMTVHCKENAQQQYQLLNEKHITLVINGTKVTIPFHSLLANCKKDSCSTFIRVLPKQSPYVMVLGEVLLTNFAITFDLEVPSVRFRRLNNLWGKMFQNKQSFGLLHKIWWFVHLLLKIIFYMSMVSLGINLYFNRKKIFKWFGRRFTGKNPVQSKSSGLAYSATLSDDIDRPVLRENNNRSPNPKDFWQVDEIEGI